jgi:hypothetical protein
MSLRRTIVSRLSLVRFKIVTRMIQCANKAHSFDHTEFVQAEPMPLTVCSRALDAQYGPKKVNCCKIFLDFQAENVKIPTK